MIRFGPSGIPLSCKGRTLKDGVEDVHNLGLNALEAQMIRMGVLQREPTRNEIGKLPTEVEGEVIVDVFHGDRESGSINEVFLTPIEKGDVLYTLTNSFAKDHIQLQRIGQLAKELDVRLTLHTPYYVDFTSNSELTYKCLDSLRWGALIAHSLQAESVISHLGLYGPHDEPAAAIDTIVANLEKVLVWWELNGLTPRLALETSGRQEVVGSVEEVLEICDRMPGVMPALNVGHIQARTDGSLRTQEDFADLLDLVSSYNDGEFYMYFAGVEYAHGNERRHTPIKKGDMKFEHLADLLLEDFPTSTVISTSPLLEHDAMYMKVMLEKSAAKRILARKKAVIEAEKQVLKEAEEARAEAEAAVEAAKAEAEVKKQAELDKKQAPAKKAAKATKKKAPAKKAGKKAAEKKPAKQAPVKKAPTKKQATSKPAPAKPATKKAKQPAKKKPAAKEPVTKAPAKKSTGKSKAKTPAKTTKAKAKQPAKKAGKTTPKSKEAAKAKTPAKKPPVKKKAPKKVEKKAAPKQAPAKKAAKKSPPKKPAKKPAKKAPAKKAPAKKPSKQAPAKKPSKQAPAKKKAKKK